MQDFALQRMWAFLSVVSPHGFPASPRALLIFFILPPSVRAGTLLCKFLALHTPNHVGYTDLTPVKCGTDPRCGVFCEFS